MKKDSALNASRIAPLGNANVARSNAGKQYACSLIVGVRGTLVCDVGHVIVDAREEVPPEEAGFYSFDVSG